MKKIITVITMVVGLASSLSAHHMAQYDGVGVNIPEDSPHLLMTFY